MKIAIIGANGQLGRYLSKNIENSKAFTRKNINIYSIRNLEKKLKGFDVVINCAAYTDTKGAESSKLNMKTNYFAVKNMSAVCKKLNIFFIHISTMSVFKNSDSKFNTELDFLSEKPITKYGYAKWKADRHIYTKSKNYLVIRPSWLHSFGKQNFITKMNSFNRNEYTIVTDDISQFTSGDMILKVINYSLVNEKLRGFINVASHETISRYDLYSKYCNITNKNVRLNKVTSKEINFDLSKINYQFMNVSKYEKLFGNTNVDELIKNWIKEEEWKQ